MKNSIFSVVINLHRDRDRLAWFLENAKAASLQVERLDAIDARNPEIQTLIQKYKTKYRRSRVHIKSSESLAKAH